MHFVEECINSIQLGGRGGEGGRGGMRTFWSIRTFWLKIAHEELV